MLGFPRFFIPRSAWKDAGGGLLYTVPQRPRITELPHPVVAAATGLELFLELTLWPSRLRVPSSFPELGGFPFFLLNSAGCYIILHVQQYLYPLEAEEKHSFN